MSDLSFSRYQTLFLKSYVLADMLACQRGLRTKVIACQRGLCANVPKAFQLLIFTCQRTIKRGNVPYRVSVFNLACQRAKCRASFSTWHSNQRAKRRANFSNILTKC